MAFIGDGRSHTAATVALVLAAVAVVGLGTGVLIGVAGRGSPGQFGSDQTPSPSPTSTSVSSTPAATPSTARPTTRAASEVERGRTTDLGYFLAARQRPDGIHVTFDRAVLYFGSEAEQQAKERGLQSDLRNGRLLVNENDLTRDMVLAPDVRVLGGTELGEGSGNGEVTVPRLLDVVRGRGDQVLLDLRYDRLGYVVEVHEYVLP